MGTGAAEPFRFSIEDFFRMAEIGLFDDRRVELIEGEIFEVSAQTNPHRTSVTKILKLLLNAFGAGDWVVVQGTLLLPKFGAPDPDFHVFDVPVGTPDDRLPLPLLVIEVSDTTYLKDSGPKLRMYAKAGIPDYWIVNIPEQRAEVYRQPERPTPGASGWRYATVQPFGRGRYVQPLARPELLFRVDDMLP